MKALLVLLSMLMLAACGADEPNLRGGADTPSSTPSSTRAADAGEPDVEPGKGVIGLRVEVRADEQAEPTVSTLTCTADEQSGTGTLQRDPKAACANARRNADLLVKGPPQDRMCAQVFGGPQIARVTGTLDGKQVDSTFKRSDGCGVADWDTLEPLLGPPPSSSD